MKEKPAPAARRRSRLPDFATRLRQRAEALGLTATEVAHRAGINPRRYAHYVNGAREPDLGTLRDISAALETTTDALLDPDWASPRQNADLREAILRIRAACLGLSLREARFLAELAGSVAVASRKRAFRSGYRADPVIDELRRVHQTLVPALLMEFEPRRLHTEIQDLDEGRARLFIDMEFDRTGDPWELSAAIAQAIRSTFDNPRELVRVEPIDKIGGGTTIHCIWNLGRRPA